MLYYIYSVLVVYILEHIASNALLMFKSELLQWTWARIGFGLAGIYTAIGIPAVIYFLIGDMQIFADWLSRVIYVLQHLGVAI